MFRKNLQILSLALCVLCMTGLRAETFYFTGLTTNGEGNDEIGEAQLSVQVLDNGDGTVQFKFFNSGDEVSVITDIYFDDNDEGFGDYFDSITSITDSDGAGDAVAFSPEANPGELPSKPDGFTTDFSLDSDTPVSQKGVNSGPGYNEWVAVSFSLEAGMTYEDVVNAVASGDINIGLHVQAFGDGQSETFVSTPPDDGPDDGPVPEPATMITFGIGAGILFLARRRSATK